MAEFHVVAHGLPPDSWRIERVQHRGAVNALAKFFIGVHSVNFVLVQITAQLGGCVLSIM